MSSHFLKVSILASGSSGNCTLLETPGASVLIDAGLSGKRIVERLGLLGKRLEDVSAVLLTHEHSDHVSGLPVLANRYQIPVYANKLTSEYLHPLVPKYKGWRIFETGSVIDLGFMQVETFSIPHDAYDPVGFVVHAGGFAAGFLTDLGYATRLAVERVKHTDVLLLEANYDLNLLRNDPRRPWAVKQRIMARHGHLSNEAAAGVVEQVISARLKHLFLGHLSEDCNTHELAEAAVSGCLSRIGASEVALHRTYQNRPAEAISLEK
ncbi:MAG: MBL fold metallo-hydrolase [Methylacidiphilales bacterium]|nr:MBL fold metallo-hydrolase [Candidatus Methylacidiphilales bacterium]